MSFKEGDYFYTVEQDDSGEQAYQTCRCLKLDTADQIAHVTVFDFMDEKPTHLDVDSLEVLVQCAPVDLAGFVKPVVIENRPVKAEELEAYFDELKSQDFIGWLEQTGQDADELAKKAEALYEGGCDLYDEEKFAEAAKLFRDAFETFPTFYEAADNEGFCHMDMEDYEEAIYCFQSSIDAHDHSFITDFSIGQCHQSLGNEEMAREWYESAKKLDGVSTEDLALIDEAIAEL